MTTQNHMATNRYVAAYHAEIEEDIRNARNANRVRDTLRCHVDRAMRWTKARLVSIRGQRTATRRIRTFDRARSTGGVEVV